MPGTFLGLLSAPYQNVGEVRNRGWEWSANYQDHRGDFGWYAGFNVTHVKNEILYMGGLDERISGETINRVGDAIGSYYAYKASASIVQRLISTELIQRVRRLNRMVLSQNWVTSCIKILTTMEILHQTTV